MSVEEFHDHMKQPRRQREEIDYDFDDIEYARDVLATLHNLQVEQLYKIPFGLFANNRKAAAAALYELEGYALEMVEAVKAARAAFPDGLQIVSAEVKP